MSCFESSLADRRRAYRAIKKDKEQFVDKAGRFPNCKGLYPDCPEKPSKEHAMCRTCPVLDEEDE